jgi:hypothetical protein
MPSLKISDQEHQTFFETLERLVPRGGMDNIHGSSGIKLRGQYHHYEGWIMIAKELIYFGNFFAAQSLLERARSHAEYLTKQE